MAALQRLGVREITRNSRGGEKAPPLKEEKHQEPGVSGGSGLWWLNRSLLGQWSSRCGCRLAASVSAVGNVLGMCRPRAPPQFYWIRNSNGGVLPGILMAPSSLRPLS